LLFAALCNREVAEVHDNRELTEGRLERFVRSHLSSALYRSTAPVSVTSWTAPGEPVPFADAVNAPFAAAAIGDSWGRPWGTVWFRVTGQVPSEWLVNNAIPEDTRAELVVDLGFYGLQPGGQAEALVYSAAGATVKAIEPCNAYVPVVETSPFEFLIEAAANPNLFDGRAPEAFFHPSALGEWETAGEEPLYRIAQLNLGLRDVQVWELLQDITTLDGLMRELPIELPRRHEILRALERMLDSVDPDDIAGTVDAGRAALAGVLAKPAYTSAHQLVAVGHAHIDSAWLWPIRETIRKCARTFSNVLALMDDHPELVFVCSSAQQLAWIEEFYPDLFERIQRRVAEGRFVPVGGMWVESDTNMPGSEAMARQFVAGKRFFLEKFAVDTEEVWLPDSFGYSAALPQIARAAGARWFLTQKISWNQTNQMPHHTFDWEGIDGTRIFTHFPPVDAYNTELSGKELAHAQSNFRDKGTATTSLIPFGWGDGGGGPTREMLAAAKRAVSLEGSPTVRIAAPSAFFEKAETEYLDRPVWSGELYLELHRGTLTSQARTKRGNRRSEHLLREAELWATAASVLTGAVYPYDELERSWHTVLLQQFHDILPGSAIAWVHKDAERNYDAVGRRLEGLIESALRTLAGAGERVLEANATPHTRNGVPALGLAESTATAGSVHATRTQSGIVLDNGVIAAAIDDHGHITSLIDATTGREAIAGGTVGNLLQLHRDTPNEWDAWDVDEFYRRNVTNLTDVDSVELETDSTSATVIVTRSFGASSITQRLRLGAGSASLIITNDIEWREREKLLKLAFPLDVHADRFASEIQFGHVFRPTHANTSWDYARFETCAHRWVHVAEPGYGVAVSNDSTYGHDVGRTTSDAGSTTTTIRLSLLRAPRFPDPETDQGSHRLTVAIRPGSDIAGAIQDGYDLNLPRRTVTGAAGVAPIIHSSNPAIIVEAIKLSEDRSGDVIVRLYESLGAKANGELTVAFPFTSVTRTDLIERPLGDAGADGSSVQLTLRPFEIVTLRLGRPSSAGVRA
jgi:alpha-mannosidase